MCCRVLPMCCGDVFYGFHPSSHFVTSGLPAPTVLNSISRAQCIVGSGAGDAVVDALGKSAETPECLWTMKMYQTTAEEVETLAANCRTSQVHSSTVNCFVGQQSLPMFIWHFFRGKEEKADPGCRGLKSGCVASQALFLSIEARSCG